MKTQSKNYQDQIREAIKKAAFSHPWTWCSHGSLPGVKMRFIPESQELQKKLFGSQPTCTGEMAFLQCPIILTEKVGGKE